MLSSPCPRSERGPLEVIWVAAYFAKRLSKHQVTGLDIPSTVDKILIDEWPSVSYRILAYLLLGVVRIFSKKVDYVLCDCHGIVKELDNFVSNKRTTSFKDLVRMPKVSITLPERYDLDAFILEVPDNIDRVHVARKEDIVLKESFQRDGFSTFSFDKYHQADVSGKTPATQGGAVLSSRRSVGDIELENRFVSDAAADKSFSPKLIRSSRAVRIIEDSLEELERIRFTQEECLDFQMFYEQNEADHLEILNSLSIGASNAERIDEFGIEDYDCVAEEDQVIVQRCSDDEPILENQDPEAALNKDVCFAVKGTPETNLSRPFVASTPEVTIPSAEDPSTMEQLGVKTPAKKERPRKPKMLRCLYDQNTTLSRKSLKRCIDDPSDLMRERKKIYSILDIWRSSWTPSSMENFSDPLIPWSVTKLPAIPKKRIPEEVCQVEVGEGLDKTLSVMGGTDQMEVRDCLDESQSLVPGADLVEVHECSDESQSLVAGVDHLEMGGCSDKTQSSPAGVDVQSDIAPGTPAPRLTSTRVFESPRSRGLDAMRQSKSFESDTRELSVDEDVTLPDWANEDMDQSEGDVEESNVCSRRTRKFANWLHRLFLNKGNRKENGVVNLSSFLRGKMKKESARLFYEILVLKSGGYVNVKQDKPYSDIIVRRTLKWKQIWAGRCPSSSQSVLC